jgi:hypothetical protein
LSNPSSNRNMLTPQDYNYTIHALLISPIPANVACAFALPCVESCAIHCVPSLTLHTSSHFNQIADFRWCYSDFNEALSPSFAFVIFFLLLTHKAGGETHGAPPALKRRKIAKLIGKAPILKARLELYEKVK